MKIKRAIIIAVAILMVTSIAGCNQIAQDSSGIGSQGPQMSGQPQETGSQIGDITDPVELEELWQEYIYDSIATVCNTQEFNSAAEIDPVNVAKFCWFKYISEHRKESLELESKDSSLRLFPLDTVFDYANRYFNLTSLDESKLSDSYCYDPQKRAFRLNLGNERRPSYTDNNAFGIHLDRVTRNNDSTVTVVMERYHSHKTRRVERIQTLTLKQREDGSMYFVNGKRDYVNNHLVTLTGDYNRFDKITGFDGHMKVLSMVGEVDGRLVLAYTPYGKFGKPSLMFANPNTLTVEKKLELDEDINQTYAKLIGDKLVVLLENRILIIDNTLEKSDEIPLPHVITEKILRGSNYDNHSYFGGYDVSSDLTRIVYSDETGVKLIDTTDNSETLLSATVQITGSDLMDHSYHHSPRFVADDKKVITTMTGYECSLGYTLYDLEEHTSNTIDMASESSSTDSIRHDSGLLEVNTYVYDKIEQTSECKTLYLDFNSEAISEIKLESPGGADDIRPIDYCYIGQNYASFITYERDVNDNANDMYYINRLDLNTLVVEPEIISIKAARTHILGVMTDGRIVFWYSLNPSENGVCVTK